MSAITHAEILASLRDILRGVFGNNSLEISDGTTAADIPGWDSLRQIKIILACEKKFGIKLRARDVNGLGNVGDIVVHLKTVIDKKTS